MKTACVNGRILAKDGEIPSGFLIFENDKIISLGAGSCNVSNVDEVIDAGGRIISPGFIDMHTHGGGGSDFMDGTAASIVNACRMHMKHGTTSIVPTTLTASMEEYEQFFVALKEAKEELKENGPSIAGVHMEGPYLSQEMCGAPDIRYIVDPAPEAYLFLLDRHPEIISWTVAPEREGALDMARELRKRGILCSMGHTNATFQEAREGCENGFSHVTHMYSAMSTITRKNAYRRGGVMEAAFLLDELSLELIADGSHIPQELLQLVCKFKSHDKIALVTDSMRAAGMPDGQYLLGSDKNGQPCLKEHNVAFLMDHSAFAGSVATADMLIRTMVKTAGLALWDAVRMMSQNPAHFLKLAHKGALAVGMDADILIFDEDITMQRVICMGKTTYTA